DHAGRAVRGAAARARPWYRQRAAPAARDRDRRRAHGLAGPDLVHHAGDLPRAGPVRRLAAPLVRAAFPRGRLGDPAPVAMGPVRCRARIAAQNLLAWSP